LERTEPMDNAPEGGVPLALLDESLALDGGQAAPPEFGWLVPGLLMARES
jgi:hypothetical protein